jgi:hypothetical protein
VARLHRRPRDLSQRGGQAGRQSTWRSTASPGRSGRAAGQPGARGRDPALLRVHDREVRGWTAACYESKLPGGRR